MFTKDEYLHSLERTYHTSGFHNAGRWFGLVYRDMRLSMLLQPDRRDRIREQRQALLTAWKEFAGRFASLDGKQGEQKGTASKAAMELSKCPSQEGMRAAAGETAKVIAKVCGPCNRVAMINHNFCTKCGRPLTVKA